MKTADPFKVARRMTDGQLMRAMERLAIYEEAFRQAIVLEYRRRTERASRGLATCFTTTGAHFTEIVSDRPQDRPSAQAGR